MPKKLRKTLGDVNAPATIAYERAGFAVPDEVYANIAEEVCFDYTEALRDIAVDNEPNPAKLIWI